MIELNPCPNCGGRLKVRKDLMTVCKDCEEIIGWYIPSVGGVKLLPEWSDFLRQEQ